MGKNLSKQNQKESNQKCIEVQDKEIESQEDSQELYIIQYQLDEKLVKVQQMIQQDPQQNLIDFCETDSQTGYEINFFLIKIGQEQNDNIELLENEFGYFIKDDLINNKSKAISYLYYHKIQFQVDELSSNQNLLFDIYYIEITVCSNQIRKNIEERASYFQDLIKQKYKENNFQISFKKEQLGEVRSSFLHFFFYEQQTLELIEMNFNFNKLSQVTILSLGLFISRCLNLKSLKLDLRNTNTVEKLDQLGEYITFCSQLQYLNICLRSIKNGMQIFLQGMQRSEHKLQFIDTLFFDFTWNQIEQIDFTDLNKMIINCSQLKHLDLIFYENKIGDQDFSFLFFEGLPPSLKVLSLNMQQLQISYDYYPHIFLRYNKLGSNSLQNLANKFVNLNEIEQIKLNLSYNQFFFIDFLFMLKNTLTCPKLIDLQIQLVKGIQNNVSFLLKMGEFTINKKLQKICLDLSKNSIDISDIKQLNSQLALIQNVKYMEINFSNIFQDNTLINIGSIFGNQQMLQNIDLNLSFCKIDLESFFFGFQKLKNFITIKLNFQRSVVKFTQFDKLANSLKQNQNLKQLQIQFDEFDNNRRDLEIFAAALKSLSHLQYIKTNLHLFNMREARRHLFKCKRLTYLK